VFVLQFLCVVKVHTEVNAAGCSAVCGREFSQSIGMNTCWTEPVFSLSRMILITSGYCCCSNSLLVLLYHNVAMWSVIFITVCRCCDTVSWTEEEHPVAAAKILLARTGLNWSNVWKCKDKGGPLLEKLIPVLCSQPAGVRSHKHGGRLPLLSSRPAVISLAAEHHSPLAGTKLYCLVTEAHVHKQLAQGYTPQCGARWPGFKPTTCWLQVWLPNHLETKPHIWKHRLVK